MNLINPTQHLSNQYSISLQICSPLIEQYFSYPSDFDPISISIEQQEIKKEDVS